MYLPVRDEVLTPPPYFAVVDDDESDDETGEEDANCGSAVQDRSQLLACHVSGFVLGTLGNL